MSWSGCAFREDALSQLSALSRRPTSFAIVDHAGIDLVGLRVVFEDAAPAPLELPTPSYYVAGVNKDQRKVYDEHCAERFAQRSPHHYSSVADVAERAELGGHMWRARKVYELSSAFIGLDGLVMQPAPPARNGGEDGAPGSTASSASPSSGLGGRLYAFERMPGFNGLGRLLLAAERREQSLTQVLPFACIQGTNG